MPRDSVDARRIGDHDTAPPADRSGVRIRTWLRLKPGSDHPPAALLICFPHAGGNAGAYADWPALVGGGFRVAAVRPPGRHERIAEEPCSSITAAADAVADEITLMAPQRLVLFGHSMGALTAFETARSLRRRGHRVPDLLVLAAPAAPAASAGDVVTQWHRRSDQQLLDMCAALGADDMYRLMRDPRNRECVLGPLRDDLACVDRYRVIEERPLQIDTRLLVGSTDPSISPDLVPRWCELLTGEFVVRTYVGNHFFVRTALSTVLHDLDRDLLGS